MIVRFRGTRGSIPIALTALEIRDKIFKALMKARGKDVNPRAVLSDANLNAIPKLFMSILDCDPYTLGS